MTDPYQEIVQKILDEIDAGDAAASGEISPALAQVLSHLNWDAGQVEPDPRYAKRLKEELMQIPMNAGAFPLDFSASAFPSQNGRVLSSPILWEEPVVRHRRWGTFLFAAVLLLTLGLGYVAFDPFASGPKRPTSVPAAAVPAATPGTPEVSPTTAPISTYGHLAVGTWQIDIENLAPGTLLNEVIMEEDGSFVSYDSTTGLSIGEWRPLSDSQVELSFFIQFKNDTQDLFDPKLVPQPISFNPNHIIVWRVTLTLDESGQTMTSIGGFQDFTNGVPGYTEPPWEMKWRRMIVDPAAVFPTPTPA